MTRLMRAHALAWCLPPTGLAAYGWLSGDFWLVALVVISLPGICICASRSTRWLARRQARLQARRVWRGPSGTLWVLVAPLVLLLPMHAWAQAETAGLADVLANSTSIATLPATAPGPVLAFDPFASLYAAITSNLSATMTAGIGTVLGWVHETLVPAASLGVIFMAIVEAFGVSAYLFWLTKYLVRVGVVLMFVDNAGDYMQWIATPLIDTANGMMNGLSGTGADAVPGHVFDVLMSHYSAGVVRTVVSLIWSSPLGALESIPLAIIAGICWLLAFAGCGLAFAVFTFTNVTLSILIIAGPLFILCSLSGPLRNWTMGWLNAVASQVLTLVFLGIALGMMRVGLDQLLDRILNMADTTNIWSRIGYIIAATVVVNIAAVFCLLSRGIATGVVSGVYTSLAPFAGQFSSAISAGQSMFSHGGGGGGAPSPAYATASMAIPHSAPGVAGRP